jgi:hypothetical protein
LLESTEHKNNKFELDETKCKSVENIEDLYLIDGDDYKYQNYRLDYLN